MTTPTCTPDWARRTMAAAARSTRSAQKVVDVPFSMVSGASVSPLSFRIMRLYKGKTSLSIESVSKFPEKKERFDTFLFVF